MTAFLKIDRCAACEQEVPREFIPPIVAAGKQLAGTGVWRSALVGQMCPGCADRVAVELKKASHVASLRDRFISEVGARPYREFTFEQYRVTSANREAFRHAQQFDPATDNLYLWGSCGVGKTHLAVAILRRWFARGASFGFITPNRLLRRLRMRSPEEEQQVLDAFTRVEVLVLDEFGNGGDTAFAHQTLQEILDSRHNGDRHGLVVTAASTPAEHGRTAAYSSLSSRLRGMCRFVKVSGPDHRQHRVNAGE